ncbi:hypothetical protein [Flavobacterium sp. PS2]|uniref:hypothetical protein n=1 Tax=Flavobacterium sp. PS2 TaxID=3384157 RepID=UPI00390CC70A
MNNLPKLDFLYFNLDRTEENYLTNTQLYYDKFDWDENHFDDYIRRCSLEELVYLMIYIYKDKYPRSVFHFAISLDSKQENLLSFISKNKRTISENKFSHYKFLREDVIAMSTEHHEEEYSDEESIEKYWRGESYMQNLFLEFNEEVPIHIIDKALEGKEYTKVEKDNVLLYEVKDSPIASLEVAKTSIKLNINEDKVILYVAIW